MKKSRTCWRCFLAAMTKIHLVDKFLIIFMALLLLQSTHSIFIAGNSTREAGDIDIIVRTSTAAVFGYFLSTNFIRRSSEGKTNGTLSEASTIRPATGSGIQNKIGFAPPDAAPEEPITLGSARNQEYPKPDEAAASRLQIIVASVIGIFCLLVLMLLRNTPGMAVGATSSAMATAMQFRDLISGCIGFLIGCPTSGDSGKNGAG